MEFVVEGSLQLVLVSDSLPEGVEKRVDIKVPCSLLLMGRRTQEPESKAVTPTGTPLEKEVPQPEQSEQQEPTAPKLPRASIEDFNTLDSASRIDELCMSRGLAPPTPTLVETPSPHNMIGFCSDGRAVPSPEQSIDGRATVSNVASPSCNLPGDGGIPTEEGQRDFEGTPSVFEKGPLASVSGPDFIVVEDSQGQRPSGAATVSAAPPFSDSLLAGTPAKQRTSEVSTPVKLSADQPGQGVAQPAKKRRNWPLNPNFLSAAHDSGANLSCPRPLVCSVEAPQEPSLDPFVMVCQHLQSASMVMREVADTAIV